jgi:transcriptional regulator with XRE-family HTH domain
MSGYLPCVPSFAEIVFAAREERGLTQTQFAAAVGVSMSTIYEVERGQRPSVSTVAKVAAFLGRKPADLVPEREVFSRKAPRKRAAVRSGAPERYSEGPLFQGGDLSQVADPDLFGQLLGYWAAMGTEERRELVDHAYRLCAPVQSRGRSTSGKSKG